MRIGIFTLAAILSLISGQNFGQERLMFMRNRHQVAFYKPGETISFRVNGQNNKITATIKGFEDSLIVFKNYKVHVSEISHMYVDESTIVWFILKYKYERIFLFGGAGYLALDALNSGELTKETLLISGSLITAGLIAHVLINNRIRIRGKKKLVILSSH